MNIRSMNSNIEESRSRKIHTVKDMYITNDVLQTSSRKKYLKESNDELLTFRVNRKIYENILANNILYFKRAYAGKLWKIITEVSFTEELICSNIQKTSNILNLQVKQYQKFASEVRRKNCKRLRTNNKKK